MAADARASCLVLVCLYLGVLPSGELLEVRVVGERSGQRARKRSAGGARIRACGVHQLNKPPRAAYGQLHWRETASSF